MSYIPLGSGILKIVTDDINTNEFNVANKLLKLDADAKLPLGQLRNTEIIEDVAGTWWQNPRAIRYTGLFDKTYFGYVDKSGNIKIGSYDYDQHKIFLYTLHSALQIDDHNAPAILIRRSDQRILVFYCKHTIENKIYYRISRNPEDISSFEPEEYFTSASNVTYPNPIHYEADDKIYVFYRRAGNTWSYRKSTDGGRNWESEIDLIQGTNQYLLIKEAKTSISNTIQFIVSDHPMYVSSHDILWFYIKLDGGAIKAYNISGHIKDESAFPVIESDLSVIYDTSAEGNFAGRAWDFIPDTDLTSPRTNLTIALSVYPTDPPSGDAEYWYLQRRSVESQWTWVKYKIMDAGGSITESAAEPHYNGGICINNKYPNTLYCSKGIGNDLWTLQEAKLVGTEWNIEDIMKEGKNIRPVTIINHGTESPILWQSSFKFTSFTDFDHDLITPFDLTQILTQDIRSVLSTHDIFMDVLAVSAMHACGNEDLSAATPITFTIDAQPDVPRTLSGHFDSHAQITEYDIEIIGIDAKGNTVTETKDETDGWDWETSNAFATITSIKMTARTGTGVDDTMDIGITDVLGLSNIIYATGDVFKIKKDNANAVVASAQVNTTYDTYDMAVIGLAATNDFTIWYKSNLNIIS